MARPRGVRRLFTLRSGRRWAENAVDLEIRHHIEMRIDELMDEGHGPEEARRIAQAAFGDMGRYRSACVSEQRRGERMSKWTDGLVSMTMDLRYALRGVRKAPGFALAVVLTLSLGIGANTAIFTVVDATILTPLEFEDPEELFLVETFYHERDGGGTVMSPEAARLWSSEGTPFKSYGFNSLARVTATMDDLVEAVRVQGFTPGLMPLIGARPLLGRPLTEGDSEVGAEAVVLVGEEFWLQKLGGDPDVVGRTVHFDGRPHRVVGVMPRRFRYPTFSVTDMWVAMREDWTVAGHAAAQIQMTVRVPEEDVGRITAGAELFAAGIQDAGTSGAGWVPRLMPLDRPSVNAPVEKTLWISFGAVGLMLLIALVNGVNLVLARSTTRAREIGVRLSLGGSRARVAGQLFVESALLALVSGAGAVGLAYLGVDLLVRIAPDTLTLFASNPIDVDHRVVLFAGGLSLVVGCLLGALPAIHAVRRRGATTLSALGGMEATSRAQHRFRGGLVVAQVGLSMLLLFGAGLLGRSLTRLTRVDPGFEAENLAVVGLVPSRARYGSAEASSDFVSAIRDRIAAMPEVSAVTASVGIPPDAGISFGDGIWIEGEDPGEAVAQTVYLPFNEGEHDLAEVLGTRLLAGRFLRADDEWAAGPVVVDRELAERLGGVETAVGKRFGIESEGARWRVVGVVEDYKAMGLDDRFSEFAAIGLHDPSRPWGFVSFVVRTRVPPEALLPALRDVVGEIDPSQPVLTLETADRAFADSLSRPRFFLVLMGVFAATAVTLASVGLFGVLSFSVNQRMREMGVRAALGASGESLLRLVIGGGLRLAGLGVVLGLTVSLWTSQLLDTLLFETSARDAGVLSAVAAVMLVVAATASFLPARRATRVDAVTVLKAE